MAQPNTSEHDGRAAGALALGRLVSRMPNPGPNTVNPRGLDADQRRLAVAITRCGTQRYRTLQYLLDRLLHQRLANLEPRLAGVLLGGAGQLLFFDGVPDYAVVDESVALAKRLVRPKAGAMVNSVLRKLTALIHSREANLPWTFASDRLPRMPGCVVFNEPVLPEPNDWPAYLSVATSLPRRLVRDWIKQFGYDRTRALALQGLRNPPTYVFEPDDSSQPWDGTHEQLTAYLEANPLRRVQDPTAAKPVCNLVRWYEQSKLGPAPSAILDLCAGRGTKSRQLAAHFPEASITVTDTHEDRRADLESLAAQLDPLEVLTPEEASGRDYDLILLDVPCTNTGVLGRRPEARYRYGHKSLTALAALQRRLLEQAAGLIRPGGVICYCTCSLQRDENDPQAKALSRLIHGPILDQVWTIPTDPFEPYQDGGYHTIARAPAR